MSTAMTGAFRRGFRWQRGGGLRSKNPYEVHRMENGWGQRFWRAWDEGWRISYVYPEAKEEVTSGSRS
jgi:hypothetical protein